MKRIPSGACHALVEHRSRSCEERRPGSVSIDSPQKWSSRTRRFPNPPPRLIGASPLSEDPPIYLFVTGMWNLELTKHLFSWYVLSQIRAGSVKT
jgi:hypothetical protein